MDIVLSNRMVSQDEEDILDFLKDREVAEDFYLQCFEVLEVKNRV